MQFDGCRSDFSLLSPPTSHVPWEGTTVNPGDLLMTQPSAELFHHDSNEIPHSAPYSFMGCPALDDVRRETPQFHCPVWPLHSMDHVRVDGNSTGRSTGPVRPVRQRFRGVRVDYPVSVPCLWQPHEDLPVCGQEITGEDIPKHLAGHGIRNMRRDLVAKCCWQGCRKLVTRQSITRHTREVHLGLKRKSNACTSSTRLVAEFH